MSEPILVQRIGLLFAVVLLAVGCNTSTTPPVAPVGNVQPAASPQEVTFFVAGMNMRLKILWGDWPNKVKLALDELEAVEWVEDEWERELISEEDLDLLFVKYDASRITVEQLLETITGFGFEAKVSE